MNQPSLFVKVMIWSMVFLMSVGFIGLVIAPFVGNTSLFGDGTGRGATEKLVAEAREDIAADNCDDAEKPTGARLERCQDALSRLASSYTTLATPAENATEVPRDAQRNFERAGEAWQALYELDRANDENAARYAGYLRDAGETEQALELWTTLSKENPQNEDYLLQKAGAQTQANDLDAAIASLRQFVRRFPDSGQVEQIREQIKALQDQQAEQAAGGGPAGPAGQPITVG